MKRQTVAWAPQAGSQEAFLASPFFETLYEGTRGPGKTDALIMDFAQHCSKGWGMDWRGVLFRRTYPELSDVIAKSRKWFSQIFPNAQYNEAKSTWKWPTGEELLLRRFEKPKDYWDYHGHAYPWIGWEELTTWPTDEGYLSMFSCVRSSNPAVRLGVRATTNPYGVGHNWVKRRFQLPSGRFRPITDSINHDGSLAPPRVAIFGRLIENKLLLNADPGYIDRLKASATNKSQLAAWIDGSWDVTSGGMFDDIWEASEHVIPFFPAHAIPGGWRIDRALDWGTSRPFSIGWWLESDGEPIELPNGRVIGQVKGDLIRYCEWYGCGEKPNTGVHMVASEVAQGIIDREERFNIAGRVKAGPADHNIFSDNDGDDDARRFRKAGVRWEKATKGPGSRRAGWQAIRSRLKAALSEDALREPAIWVTQRCEKSIEILPVAPRSDYDLDDIDTEAEDHIPDEWRYRVHRVKKSAGRRNW